MKSMRNSSQKTVIGAIREHVDLWRRQQGMTHQVAAACVVDAYFSGRFDRVWPIDFVVEGDDYRRLKNNSDRVWRWLDDQTKQTVLLPANLIPAVLSALPQNLRLQCVVELLAPLGMAPTLLIQEETDACHSALMASAAKESGEGLSAFALLANGMTPEQLRVALAEVEESISAQQELVHFVKSRLGEVAA
ncbi:hypothetical protein LQR30_15700 [Chromobacterium piscinae]|uniref:hypothetical protein n=1 Tax=Chromobacterium piscinae TaxID=686831 RepID=UPI001E3EE189|nr:hypothetical protein [Chromobacterium piscinae]MCD4505543.1 hypothetical protein [Chromobacterium piscinae]